MPGGICPRCNRPVFNAEAKEAFGKVWHSFCFSCNMCRALLDVEEAVTGDDEIYCQVCALGHRRDEPSRREGIIRKDSHCTRSACRVTFADSSQFCSSTCPDSHADNRIPSKSPKATPSPTAITTWYNRQHPSSHSDLGGRRYSCDGGCFVDNLVKTQDGQFTVSLQRVSGRNIRPMSASRSTGSRRRDSDRTFVVGSSSSKIRDCSCDSRSSKSSSYCGSANCVGNYSPRTHWYGGGVDCRRCGRKVYHAEMVLASEGAFHNICFSCYTCRKPLDTVTVYGNQGEIYCKQCYIKLFGPTGYGYGAGAGVLQTPF